MLRFLIPAVLATFPILALPIWALPVWACTQSVCQVDPNTLALPRVITFEDQRATMGPGHLINGIWELDGAVFAERFIGQRLEFKGLHDVVSGPAIAPLTPQAGPPGQSMSLVMMSGNKVLNGFGPKAYPSRDGQGEGALAVMFDTDQSALAFDIRGGEGGTARVQFLRRDGSVIADLSVAKLHEHSVGFQRQDGITDIAGIVLTNTDPQGLALDNLRFGRVQILG